MGGASAGVGSSDAVNQEMQRLRHEVAQLQAAISRAEAEKKALLKGGPGGAAVNDAAVSALQSQLSQAVGESASLKQAVFSKDQEIQRLQAELQLSQGKVQRMETDQQGTRTTLEGDVSRLKQSIADRDRRIEALEQSLAGTEAKLRKKEEEMFMMSRSLEEIGELREFKEEAARREEQQRVLMQQQTARLQEYERLYKEELNMRKKYFNMLEDGKGEWVPGPPSPAALPPTGLSLVAAAGVLFSSYFS